MTKKKIIPCLDVKNGKVVKGIKFVDIKDVGDIVEFAKSYENQGADELTLLDITATNENRNTFFDIAQKTAKAISIPLIVGGGVKTIEDFEKLFSVGVSKVSVNTSAVLNPNIIKQASDKFGKEKVIVAIDVNKNALNGYTVLINGGTKDTGIDAVLWAKKVEALGCGEILLTSMDADGTKDGYDIEITKLISDAVSIPVTASGGCGKIEDFLTIFKQTNVASALGASVFHFGELTVKQVKQYLSQNEISVNL